MKNEKTKQLLFCLLLSTLFITLFSKCSPLYPLQDWVDANAFFTMGRGLINGKIPYLDLFEQKGPLLYFIHAIGAFISNTSFLGIYLLEILSMTIFLYYIGKIIEQFLNKKANYILLPIVMMTLFTTNAFKYGDSAEEFCLPLLTISLYHMLYHFKTNLKELKPKHFIIDGILASSILWIKYTMLGFHFAFMASFFFLLLSKKEIKKAITSCLYFLLGMIIPTVPILLFFQINGATKELFHVYFTLNMTSYGQRASILSKLGNALLLYLNRGSREVLCFILTILGFIFFTIKNKYLEKTSYKIALITTYLFLILGVYFGGKAYIYYFLIFVPFTVLGLIHLYQLKERNIEKKGIALIISLSFLITLGINQNIKSINIDYQKTAQYQFGEIIKKKKNSTILNYGFLDGGFYLSSNRVPSIYYFERQNMPYEYFPENQDEQNRYIKEKKIDYVILRLPQNKKGTDVEIPYLNENYNMVKEIKQQVEGKKVNYVLFEQK